VGARHDRETRSRVEQGEVLTLSNLLRLGTTYTREPRITYQLLDRYGQDSAVSAIADRRAADLLRALAVPNPPLGMLEMRALLRRMGFSLATAEERTKTKAFLMNSLASQRDEATGSRQQARADHSQLFRDRGLSTDSDLYTGYALEKHFQNMLSNGLLKAGRVRRVAIIGPGLDYVNKKLGYDFYPPQAIQPFAAIDSLARLGLADLARLEVCTFDISPWVNQHLARARGRAAAGLPYTIQLVLPSYPDASPDFSLALSSYWKRMGEKIGKPSEPIPPPA
jgi:hypothetical protein